MRAVSLTISALILAASAVYVFFIPAHIDRYIETAAINPLQPSHKVKVLIGGDIMLDRYNRTIGNKKGYDSLFAGIKSLLQSADISVANLEGPITSEPTKTIGPDGKYTQDLDFTFATSTALAIANAGIDLVSLANNHSDNFGQRGSAETKDWLRAANVEWFGDPANRPGFSTKICMNDICITFVGYHEFRPGLATILDEIRKVKTESDMVIVMPHWGDEYAERAPDRLRDEAEKMVSAGADAIIGAHPHVVEDREWLGRVPVIYSLGNLVFDQFFSPETMDGNIAELTVTKGSSGAHIDQVRIFTISNKSRTGPVVLGEPIEFSP